MSVANFSLVFATHNLGKLRECQAILAVVGITVVSLNEVKITDEVAETGSTFEANAQLKAQALASQLQRPVIADDSGLEIQALGGQPGVHSKRFFPGTDADRNEYVLSQLKGTSDRRAQFVSVVWLSDPIRRIETSFRGEVKGVIADKSRGDKGFGYDPIFIPEGFTQTMAELGAQIKNQISHRARALQQLQEFLSLTYDLRMQV